MVKIAIVEDDDNDANLLNVFIEKYSKSNQLALETTRFKNPLLLVDNYSSKFDLIFLDIKMPLMNGMEAAKKIREKDKNVVIIFITSLAQFAVQGYEVEALDFIVKPIEYNEFSLKLNRALLRIHQENRKFISLNIGTNLIRLDTNEIIYIESKKHKVIFHTTKDKYEIRNTLVWAEKEINDSNFCRCNNCYLVNLSYVLKIDGNDCILPNARLLISRPKKKYFQEVFVKYLEG
ncbi:MAG: LytTR family DNA-binding domain-containing protein [Bacilli bacterium]|jgi:DNA-binding LytR/AlgR family response regulator